MTPQDVAALTALAAIVKEMGTWPVLSIVIFLVIGPWVAMMVLSWISERRHAEVVQMYKNNVLLLETTQDLANGMRDIVILTTQTMSKVQSSVESNLFCPLMRKEKKVEQVVKQ